MSDDEKESTIRKVVDRLAVRFPNAPPARIAGIVREEYELLDSGRIRIYVPTLAEKAARTRLNREFDRVPRPADSTGPGVPGVSGPVRHPLRKPWRTSAG